MNEGREFRRVFNRIAVMFGVTGFVFPGQTLDISMSGLHIFSKHPLPMGSKVTVGFGASKEKIVSTIKGEVTWLITPPMQDASREYHHMGIRLIWHDEKYMKMLSNLIKQQRLNRVLKPERREGIRYEHQVEVIFEHMDEIYHQLTQNLSHGGIFICTDHPLPKDTELSLRIVIPQIMEDVCASGRVAFSINLQTAQKLMRPPGMGIKLLSFDEEDGEKFASFIRKLSENARRLGALSNAN